MRATVIHGSSPFSWRRLKIGSKRHEKDDEDVEDDEAGGGQENRVGQGADHLGFKVFLLFGEVGDATQHVFEETAFLTSADHADGQLIEGVGVLAHGFAQAHAVGDAGADLAEDFRKGGLRTLAFENVEAAEQRYAGVQEIGQLRVEGGEVAAANTAAAAGRRFCRDNAQGK